MYDILTGDKHKQKQNMKITASLTLLVKLILILESSDDAESHNYIK